jgi:hypothetical protein
LSIPVPGIGGSATFSIATFLNDFRKFIDSTP